MIPGHMELQLVSNSDYRGRALHNSKVQGYALAIAAMSLVSLSTPSPLSAQTSAVEATVAQSVPGAVDRPWLDVRYSPDERADAAVNAMTRDEMLLMVRGYVGANFMGMIAPEGARDSAGFVPGVPRLGISPLWQTDAMLGVANLQNQMRPGDTSTAFPSTLLVAATFDPQLSFEMGAAIGREAHSKGYNVLLGGGVNLVREPRNGRNFEYFSEDPLLTGLMGGAAIRGTQSENVISTAKHFVLNATQTNQNTLDVLIDRAALRASDLLAFQIAIEQGQPGAVMCSYNGVNGAPTCGNEWLLNTVLKGEWGYKGWVMSDWGATKSEDFAAAGLDQQSGSQMDMEPWFDAPLRAILDTGQLPMSRLKDMARRILRSMFAVGIHENPALLRPYDTAPSSRLALEIARKGLILLKNENNILPLSDKLDRAIAIGGFAHKGVPRGSGSSEVFPTNGAMFFVPTGGEGVVDAVRDPAFLPSSPLDALRDRRPSALISYNSGTSVAEAALLAKKAEVAIVFATRHETESKDNADMNLPAGVNELISAVAKANPNTIVILLTGNPVLMPWEKDVKAIVAGFFPGQEGGQAIAELLAGEIEPSGRLPISFPISEADLPHPNLPNAGVDFLVPVTAEYNEGADIGYRWYARQGRKTHFPFGYGLSYSSVRYSDLKVTGGDKINLSFTVTNTGLRKTTDTPQIYLTHGPEGSDRRLLSFARIELAPGKQTQISLEIADPRLFGRFDGEMGQWKVPSGTYTLAVSTDAETPKLEGRVQLNELTRGP